MQRKSQQRVNVSSSFRNISYTLGDEIHTFAEFLNSPGRFLTSEYKCKLFSYFHLRGGNKLGMMNLAFRALETTGAQMILKQLRLQKSVLKMRSRVSLLMGTYGTGLET